jgi:hypothetical protein
VLEFEAENDPGGVFLQVRDRMDGGRVEQDDVLTICLEISLRAEGHIEEFIDMLVLEKAPVRAEIKTQLRLIIGRMIKNQFWNRGHVADQFLTVNIRIAVRAHIGLPCDRSADLDYAERNGALQNIFNRLLAGPSGKCLFDILKSLCRSRA